MEKKGKMGASYSGSHIGKWTLGYHITGASIQESTQKSHEQCKLSNSLPWSLLLSPFSPAAKRPKRRWEGINIQEIVINTKNLADSTQDRNYRRALMNSTLYIRHHTPWELVMCFLTASKKKKQEQELGNESKELAITSLGTKIMDTRRIIILKAKYLEM